MDKILYIDDELVNTDVFEATFKRVFEVYTANDTQSAVKILKEHEIPVVLTDQRMPYETGIEFIERVQNDFPDVVFMILSAYTDFDVAIKVVESGRVHRFIQKPWNEKQLTVDIDNAIEKYNILKWNKQLLINLERQNRELILLKEALEDENIYLKTEIGDLKSFENIITQDEELLHILQGIEKLGNSNAPVLITGETGTGKELIARALHSVSVRSSAPFIAVNCAAIPETLFESELFGHEKGAFTGAISSKKGKFELANNGTLFLDEVGEIPVAMQPKLLRAIQEGCIEKVGSTSVTKLNIRIISATNRNLSEDIKDESFRSDLYYRLSVFPIELPPLRERVDDISLLVDHFIGKYNKKYNSKIDKVGQSTMNMLRSYEWPGNIRELENVIERAVITSKGRTLVINEGVLNVHSNEPQEQSLNLLENERKLILQALKQASWKMSGKGGAAELLGVARTTLQYRMEKLNIKKGER